jgi:hypothetical protein
MSIRYVDQSAVYESKLGDGPTTVNKMSMQWLGG